MTAVTDFTDTYFSVEGHLGVFSEDVDLEGEVFVDEWDAETVYLAIQGGNELVDQCSLGAELSPEQALAVADALVQAATADVDGGQS